MLIGTAVKKIHSISDGWVRVEHVRRMRGGVELCLGVYQGRQGTRVECWIVSCRGVLETSITDLDGGGLAFYSNSHPAAQQYVARRVELRWRRGCDETKVLAALFRAHVRTVDDWIPFDKYLQINTPWNGTSFDPEFAPVSGKNFVCRGPEFLIQAYAGALEAIGEPVEVRYRATSRSKAERPSVLHFGMSYIVATKFSAQRSTVH